MYIIRVLVRGDVEGIRQVLIRHVHLTLNVDWPTPLDLSRPCLSVSGNSFLRVLDSPSM